jgi:integrase
VLELLRRRKEENAELIGDDGGWVFPARVRANRNSEGRVVNPARGAHVQEVKEQRYAPKEKGKPRRKVEHLPSPHRLRDTFATAAHEAGVSRLDLKLLMNHATTKGDVTEGYQMPSTEHLRECAKRITAFLLERMEPND